MNIELTPINKINGDIEVPSDKSITHRAFILSAIANGASIITNFLNASDCLNTIKALKSMGIKIKIDGNNAEVYGNGLHLKPPKNFLNFGNSGTGARLLTGILAAQSFSSFITGDKSLRKRPMKRILIPLQNMGAQIIAHKNNYLPIAIKGKNKLNDFFYDMPVASAQVKSCLLFAGLYTKYGMTIKEPQICRNHTEIMLKEFGALVFLKKNIIKAHLKDNNLIPTEISIPGDISSAAFFIVAALITPKSKLTIHNVSLNPTRTGLLEILLKMGANIKIIDIFSLNGELRGKLIIKYSKLKAIKITPKYIPFLIDELPIFAIAAASAKGDSVVTGAKELRVKETDRIKAICHNLKNIGINCMEKPDGFIINGDGKIFGGNVDSFGDHRIAMAFSIAALISKNNIFIKNVKCIETSFPNFFKTLKSISF